MNLYFTFYIRASLDTIWQIITGPQSKDIFYGAEIQSKFEINSTVEYIGPGRNGESTRHIYGKVLDYQENKLFKMTSNVGEVYRPGLPAYESIITYKLEDLGFAVKLDIIHEGWHKEDPSYDNTKNNWWLMLSNIKTLAETGKPLVIGLHE